MLLRNLITKPVAERYPDKRSFDFRWFLRVMKFVLKKYIFAVLLGWTAVFFMTTSGIAQDVIYQRKVDQNLLRRDFASTLRSRGRNNIFSSKLRFSAPGNLRSRVVPPVPIFIPLELLRLLEDPQAKALEDIVGLKRSSSREADLEDQHDDANYITIYDDGYTANLSLSQFHLQIEASTATTQDREGSASLERTGKVPFQESEDMTGYRKLLYYAGTEYDIRLECKSGRPDCVRRQQFNQLLRKFVLCTPQMVCAPQGIELMEAARE